SRGASIPGPGGATAARWASHPAAGGVVAAYDSDSVQRHTTIRPAATQATTPIEPHRNACAQPPATPPAQPSPVAGATASHALSTSAVAGWAHDAAPGGSHKVVKGDTLWDIADDELGDPLRWRDIYMLNRGRPQANGYALTDPDEIHVGWVLTLPARDAVAAP